MPHNVNCILPTQLPPQKARGKTPDDHGKPKRAYLTEMDVIRIMAEQAEV